MKYSEIKTMDQLEKARKKVRQQIGRKGEEVKDALYDVRESYSRPT